MTPKIVPLIMITCLILFVSGVGISGVVYETSLEKALEAAKKDDLPVLVKFGISWSKESLLFDEAIKTNPEIMAVLKNNVILCVINSA